MSLFVSNTLIGWIGGFYEKMTPAEFWAMHAAIAAGGACLSCYSVAALITRFTRRRSCPNNRFSFSPFQLSAFQMFV